MIRPAVNQRTRGYLWQLHSRFREYPLVVEVRHASWITDEILAADREPGSGQADGEAPTNAMDGERRPPVTANADVGLERGVGRDVPPLVSQVSVPRAGGAEDGSVTPWILVLS